MQSAVHGENSPKIFAHCTPEPRTNKRTPHPGPLLFGRGEGESSAARPQSAVHGEGSHQLFAGLGGMVILLYDRRLGGSDAFPGTVTLPEILGRGELV